MGNIRDDVLGDVGERVGGGHVDERSFRSDFDHGLGAADLQGEIKRGQVTDFDGDAFTLQRGKPGHLHRNGIGARRKIGEPVVAGAIGFKLSWSRPARASQLDQLLWALLRHCIFHRALQATGGFLSLQANG